MELDLEDASILDNLSSQESKSFLPRQKADCYTNPVEVRVGNTLMSLMHSLGAP